MNPYSIFCDGGLLGANPSRLGGTWAYRWLDEQGLILRQGSGLITPDDLGKKTVSNNDTELIAALRGLTGIPKEWSGTLFTDSKVTLHRLNKMFKVKKWKVVLVGGHPTKGEIAAGKRARNGLPVSLHNCWCDNECTRIANLHRGKVMS